MKKLILMAAAAAMTLAGCEKKGPQTGTTTGNGDNTLVVKIENTVGNGLTRSDEAAYTANQITLSNAHIYIFNAAGEVMSQSKSLTAAELTAKEVTIEGVNADDQLFIVANYPTTGSTAFTPTDYTTKTAVLAASSTIKYDGTPVNTNYKKPFMANFDGNAVNLADYTATGDPKTITAEVKLSPLYARFEIAQITGPSSMGNSTTSGFTVTGVYMDNYYPGFTMAGGSNGTLFAQSKTTPITLNGIGDPGSWAAEIGVGPKSVTPATPGNVWAYHVGPGTAIPQIIVRLDELVGNDNYTANPVQYLTVTGYQKDGAAFAGPIERGMIYKISDIVFTEDNLNGTPVDNSVNVTATITVTDWSEVALTPVLE